MNNMLISTMLKFVLYDGKPHILHEGDLSKGDAHYNGITWNDNYIFVSAAIDTKYVIRSFDKQFNPFGILEEGDLHEVHQIFWHKNKLYVTNTGLNRIEVWDSQWHHYAWHKSTCDIDHINSIWSNGSLFFVTEFGNRDERKVPSKIKICDFDQLSFYGLNRSTIREIPVGNGIHNVYYEDRTLYTLMSKKPAIMKIGLHQSRPYELLPVKDGLIRGLARTKDFWYIGVSRWETERDKRYIGDVIILQLDNAFKEVDRLILPDFGPVCDIRVIDEPDLAHNGVSL